MRQAKILAFVFLLLWPTTAEAYIGPGAGFAALGSFLVMFLAMLSAIATLFTWPIRYLVRLIRGWRIHAASRIKRFVVLGLDGMDPTLVEAMMETGKLPNLSRLRQSGCYRRLATTIPPLSPVAWSSFLTGCNPGKHNIFDFLSLDKRSYLPKLSSVRIGGPRRTLHLRGYRIPLGKPDIRLLRKGKPFWNLLGNHGIFSDIIRVPITFPPEKFHGVLLSAMCIPDLRGSQGTFLYYTTKRTGEDEHIGGEQIRIQREGNRIRGALIGPANPLRPDQPAMKCPFEIVIDERHGKARLRMNGEAHPLEKGRYTDWIGIPFKTGLGQKVWGICQFLLLNIDPEFELYVTPIQIDPNKPAMPISHPTVYATYLAKNQGRYATLGLAEDSWALNTGIINDNQFWEQVVRSDREREKMFFDALEKVRRGLVVCVFDGTDRVQHMFWRYLEENHPADPGPRPGQHRRAIEMLYRLMDELVGRTLAACNDPGTVLMVISDHGFKPFRRGVDLNRWLEENGYLTRKAKANDDGKYLSTVDFSRTRAFAIGLAGIYLNIRGRESKGIVEAGEEAAALRTEIVGKLSGLVDKERGQIAINKVYESEKIYSGPYKDMAPDLIVGYDIGYRVSWDAAVGKVTDRVFCDNNRAWSGDHCIDPQLVPGVLFCNRRIATVKPRLIDVGPTVLDLFGIPVPRYMDGKAMQVAEYET